MKISPNHHPIQSSPPPQILSATARYLQGSSTLSSSSKSSCFISVLTFIPRTICAFLKCLFCCFCSSKKSLADQIAQSPTLAAQKTIKLFEKKGYDQGLKSLENALQSLEDKETEWMRAQIIEYHHAINEQALKSKNDDVKDKLPKQVALLLKKYV